MFPDFSYFITFKNFCQIHESPWFLTIFIIYFPKCFTLALPTCCGLLPKPLFPSQIGPVGGQWAIRRGPTTLPFLCNFSFPRLDSWSVVWGYWRLRRPLLDCWEHSMKVLSRADSPLSYQYALPFSVSGWPTLHPTWLGLCHFIH